MNSWHAISLVVALESLAATAAVCGAQTAARLGLDAGAHESRPQFGWRTAFRAGRRHDLRRGALSHGERYGGHPPAADHARHTVLIGGGGAEAPSHVQPR